MIFNLQNKSSPFLVNSQAIFLHIFIAYLQCLLLDGIGQPFKIPTGDMMIIITRDNEPVQHFLNKVVQNGGAEETV